MLISPGLKLAGSTKERCLSLLPSPVAAIHIGLERRHCNLETGEVDSQVSNGRERGQTKSLGMYCEHTVTEWTRKMDWWRQHSGRQLLTPG